MTNQICIDKSLIFTAGCVIVFSFIIFYYTFKKETFNTVDLYSSLSNDQLKNKLVDTHEKLFQTELEKQECERQLSSIKSNIRIHSSRVHNGPNVDISMQRIYNPLVGPERIYPNLNNDYSNYQQLGFISSGMLRLPLFGRRKYRRSDKWEYYVIDNSENKIKIPIKTVSDNELYSGEAIQFDGQNFSVFLYDIDTIRYNPDIY